MPRDISGTYTLPPGNPVVGGSIIESAWANDTMADIAVQLNNVITRDGQLTLTSPLAVPDGTVANPGLTFINQTNLGFYRKSANVIGISVAGIEVATFTLDGLVSAKAPTIAIPPLQTANFTAEVNKIYRIDAQTCTNITFPASAVPGQWIELQDPLRKWTFYTTTIASNKFNGSTQTFVCDRPGASLRFTWIDATRGWECTLPHYYKISNGGSYTFPSGLILQWGRIGPFSAGPQTPYAFPTAFSHACTSVVVSSENSAASSTVVVTPGSVSQVAFGVTVASGTNVYVHWQAIGY